MSHKAGTTERAVRRDDGYVMLGVVVLLALGLTLTAGMLSLTSVGTKTRAIIKTQAEYQYECEETLNKTVAWLQSNSRNLVSAFRGENFNTLFTLGSPSHGNNEGEHFETPTLVKLSGSNNSPMLSNNNFFGTPDFPNTTNVLSGASFNAVQAFQQADLGNANARVVMVWARQTGGNYEPVFRVDAVTGNNPDRGAHMFTYIYSQLVTEVSEDGGASDNIGFFTEDGDFETKTGNNQCFSYMWTHNGASWDRGGPRSNCVIASKQNIKIKSKINGSVFSKLNNGVTILGPTGEVSGEVCTGNACHNHSLVNFPDWSATCAGNSQGNLVVSANTTLMSGPALNQQCWETVTVNSNRTLTLNDKDNPYRFKTLQFQNNSNSRMQLLDMLPDEKVTVFVDNFDGGTINGNQAYNLNNAPRNFVLNVTSGSSFKLNGTADMHARIFAPQSDIEMLGTFNFHGKIEASQMLVTGNGRFNYDEGLSVVTPPTITDMRFTLKKASQRYR